MGQAWVRVGSGLDGHLEWDYIAGLRWVRLFPNFIWEEFFFHHHLDDMIEFFCKSAGGILQESNP